MRGCLCPRTPGPRSQPTWRASWRSTLPTRSSHSRRGQLTVGHDLIRAVYTEFLAGRPSLKSAGQQPAIINSDTALTSTRLPGSGATVEVARLQPDGTWRWIIDQPSVLP
ncbi:MAG: hypothetical protein JOY82_14260 [Streptosporangiaceae bacterium]|nr:hypothetical protein [Streptosporangiaceae bacterium]MBV9855652.1 hypothetical protein [Streptosporangiaceae bacterium]